MIALRFKGHYLAMATLAFGLIVTGVFRVSGALGGASGAEAVAVGGVRIGPNVTIRQAGGGMLVDNQPITSPYVVLAIGPQHAMRDAFERSPALQRLRLLEGSYRVGVSVSEADALTVPASSVRDVNFAKKIGPP